MSKEKDDNKKERAEKYEEKVTFDGTFEDMVGMSVKSAEGNKEDYKKNKMGDYINTNGRNCLILKRDWAKFNNVDTPKTEPCHFCGAEHIHGGNDGYRIAHCNSPIRTYIANDGTKLSSDDGYWIKDINKP